MESAGSLKKTVYNELMGDIVKGELRANDIVTENSLIQRFSVSKAPVREALIELCKDGFLRSLPRYGYQVVQCTVPEIIEMLDFREDLEVGNLKRCFPFLTPGKLSVFSDNIDEWEKKGDIASDLYGNYYRNQYFHLLLCSLSGNGYVYRELEKVLRSSARFFAVYYSSAWDNGRESKGLYHHMIFDALKAGSLYDACSYLAKDISAVRDEIRKVIS